MGDDTHLDGLESLPGFRLSAIFDAFYGHPDADTTARRDNGRRRRAATPAGGRSKRTRVLLAQVAEILAEYSAHLPLTVRQVFYQLVAAHGYEKTERGYQRLCEHLVRARRARLIPFEHIRDDGVWGHPTPADSRKR